MILRQLNRLDHLCSSIHLFFQYFVLFIDLLFKHLSQFNFGYFIIDVKFMIANDFIFDSNLHLFMFQQCARAVTKPKQATIYFIIISDFLIHQVQLLLLNDYFAYSTDWYLQLLVTCQLDCYYLDYQDLKRRECGIQYSALNSNADLQTSLNQKDLQPEQFHPVHALSVFDL